MTLFRKKRPKFTNRELIAIKTLSGIYLESLDKKDADETMRLVKDTLRSVKHKVEAANIKDDER